MEPLLRTLHRSPRALWLCQACHHRAHGGWTPIAASDSILVGDGQARQNVRRVSQTSIRGKDSELPRRQTQALGDFYTDLLSAPIPKESAATSDLPTFVKSGDESKEERAAKLFGNIHGSGYERRVPDKPDATWRTINGVPIPPRPAEPDNCCMSGCMHCVWDDYRDDIEDWAKRLGEAQAKGVNEGQTSTPKLDMHRPEVATASGSMDDDGGGSESLWHVPSSPTSTVNELLADVPVGIREFMATEKRLRERKRARKEQKS